MKDKKYTLSWGIHAGTLTSRDIGDSYKFDTEQQCIDKANELREHFLTLGYKIWFANTITPEGVTKNIMSNMNY